MNLLKTYKGLPKEIYILFIGRIINCIGSFIYPLLSLILTQKIGLSIAEAGFVITLSGICQAPCMIIGGKLVDTLGAKKVLVFFETVSALLFVICGLIKPSYIMIAIIIASSCVSSMAGSSFDTIVANITTDENRKSSFSLVYIGLNLGFAIGPAIGGFLLANHLPIIFIGDALTTLISVVLIAFFIDEKNVLISHNDSVMEEKTEGSLLKVFKARPILIYFSLLMLTFQVAYSQFSFSLPLQVNNVFGNINGPKYYGFLASFNGVIVILLTPIITALTKKFRIISVMACGGLLYAVSLAVCGFSNNLPAFFFIVIAYTTGEILISINDGTFIANLSPASHRGRISSVLPIIIGAGYMFGPTLMGQLTNTIGMTKSFIVIGAIAGLGAIIMFSLNGMYKKLMSIDK